MRYATLVMGPAGSGKSTYCRVMAAHLEVLRRPVHVVNLDPAAEQFDYPVAWDIRDVISVEDTAEALGFGPNGGLVYCMEFLMSNLEVMEEFLGAFDDDYLIFDCPGQIELYTHIPIMKGFIRHLHSLDYHVAAVYLLDSQFLALSAMIHLEVPHLNVLSKMDLIHDPQKKRDLEGFLSPDSKLLLEMLDERTAPQMHQLNRAIAGLVDDYSLVRFLPLDAGKEESVAFVQQHVDLILQYGEDEDVQVPKDIDEDEENH